LIALWYFIDDVKSLLYSSRSVKKDGMYVGYKEIGGSEINGNRELQGVKYGMRLPIEVPKNLL